MNTRGFVCSLRFGKTWALTAAIIALLLAFALPKAALAADDYEAASAEGLATQAGGLTVSPSAVNFFLYPGYTQGQSVRAITVTNNTGAAVTNIRFANFQGHKATFTDGSQDFAPYVVVENAQGRDFLTDCFSEADDSGSVQWVPWAVENGYTSLDAGKSRTYYLAIENDWMWPGLANGTDITDKVDLVSSAGTTTLTLHARVYEPAKGIVTAQIGTKPEAVSPEVSPASSISLGTVAAGQDAQKAVLFGLKNTSTAVDPATGQKPNIILRSASIENDPVGVFGLIAYEGMSGYPIGDDPLNMAIGPDAAYTLGVTADASYVPAGTYTANVRLWVTPGTITLNSGVQVGKPNAEGYTPITIPVSVTVTGGNPNLRAAPKNLKAEAGNGIVVLTWDGVPANTEGYSDYYIWRTGGGEDSVCDTLNGETQYVDRDVQNGTEYTYYVGCVTGGTSEQAAKGPKAGPVKATPSANATAKLDQPYIDTSLDGLPDAVRAEWHLQDRTDNGAGTVDHFNVYLNKQKVAEVKQGAVQEDDGDYYWTCDIPVKVPWMQYCVNVAAVSVDGTEGFWSETAFGEASSSTPVIQDAALSWNYETATIEARAWVEVGDGVEEVTVQIDRDGERMAAIPSNEWFVDANVKARRTYTYTFTAVADNGKASEPYKMTIYTDPNDYSGGESDAVPVTVAPDPQVDPAGVNVTVDTQPGSTYVVKRDDNESATFTGTGGQAKIVDYPGTGVHTYQVDQRAGGGNTVATSPTKGTEVVAVDAQPGATVVVRTGTGNNGGKALSFTDVPDDAWFHDSVYYVAARGLMGGYEGTTLFGPYDTMQRGQLAVVLWRYTTGHDATYDYKSDKRAVPLADIEDGKYYTEAANWAFDNGIITGVGGTRFDPYGTVTMEQFVTIMARYFEKGSDSSHSTASLARFTDGAAVPAWADNAMAWCVDHGLVKGYDVPGGPYLRPGEGMQRGRAVTLFARCYTDGLMR